MKRRTMVFLGALATAASTSRAFSQTSRPASNAPSPTATNNTPNSRANITNFIQKRAHIIDNSSYIKIVEFTNENLIEGIDARLHTFIKWKNVSERPIVAWETGKIYFDPFHRRLNLNDAWLMTGVRVSMVGRGRGWTPLLPGEDVSDLIRYGSTAQPVMESFVYIKKVRLFDGEIWTFNPRLVLSTMRRLVPEIQEFGEL